MITIQESIPNLKRLDSVITDLNNLNSNLKFWVAGGAITSAVTNEKINDYDIFSPDPELIINVLLASSVQATFETENFVNFRFKNKKIQIIKRYKPHSPEEIFEKFDFTVVCGAYDGKNFYCHDRFWQDVANRKLVVNATTFPLKTMERVAKYARRGYKPCPVGLLKIARAINEMKIDWDNPDENQLSFYSDGTPRFIGVD